MCSGIKYSTKGLHWPTMFTKASLFIILRPYYHDVCNERDKAAACHLAVKKKNASRESMVID